MTPTAHPHYFRYDWIEPTRDQLNVDVCIYGATSAGVAAAVKAAALGHSVALLNPGVHTGGMTAGGLGLTDYGKQHVIGGMARDFYRRVAAFYRSQGRLKPDDPKTEVWLFEPSAASAVFKDWLDSAGVTVRHRQFIARVVRDGGRISEVVMLGGLRVAAKVFMDATYEGDLLALADVPYVVGRESNGVFNETLNGVQVHKLHQFSPACVDPFVIAGDPSSGLLPGVEVRDLRCHVGRGDHKVQAYNFRVCMTDDPSLRVPWSPPEEYDVRDYELAARWFSQDEDDGYNGLLAENDPILAPAGLRKYDVLTVPTPAGHRKTDTNNHGPVSSDFIGHNYAWAESDYAQREAIFQAHVRYQQGFYWFLANDERVPTALRASHQRFGLSRDEFVEYGHWSPQLYVREARRMRGDYVLSEHDCRLSSRANDPIAMGSYNLDSHNCSRFAAEVEGRMVVLNDGDVQVPPAGPYGISYRCVVPPAGSVTNLIVPVCVSATHIAYGSVRMEPVFMALGESCAIAASMAIRDELRVQDVPYRSLRDRLEGAGQVVAAS